MKMSLLAEPRSFERHTEPICERIKICKYSEATTLRFVGVLTSYRARQRVQGLKYGADTFQDFIDHYSSKAFKIAIVNKEALHVPNETFGTDPGHTERAKLASSTTVTTPAPLNAA